MRRVLLTGLLSVVLLLTVACSGFPFLARQQVAVRADSEAASASRVLVISVDGLNPRALVLLGRGRTPNLHRLIREGASTLNARTVRERTETLPNHTSMVTGRRVYAPAGGHGVNWNDDRTDPSTVQEAAGGSVASLFSAVHDSGGASAVFASKEKLRLFRRSWPAGVDRIVIRRDNARLVRLAKRDLLSQRRTITFVHLSRPDVVGHRKGYMTAAYLRAVAATDAQVGRFLRALDNHPTLARETTVLLTSDHGGRGKSHSDRTQYVNYRVPFLAWGAGVAAGEDLYALNPDYADPGRTRPAYTNARQPVRNAAVADLALDLLGLPPVPGSTIDADQDLDVR
jgi:predicted AlkP superfamily pyrophosphatase or phosphodiesterase